MLLVAVVRDLPEGKMNSNYTVKTHVLNRCVVVVDIALEQILISCQQPLPLCLHSHLAEAVVTYSRLEECYLPQGLPPYLPLFR